MAAAAVPRPSGGVLLAAACLLAIAAAAVDEGCAALAPGAAPFCAAAVSWSVPAGLDQSAADANATLRCAARAHAAAARPCTGFWLLPVQRRVFPTAHTVCSMEFDGLSMRGT